MNTYRLAGTFVLSWICAAAGSVSAQENVAPVAEQSVEKDLVLGDSYTIEAAVERGGLTATLSGDLMKLNDEWIVLRRVCEGRREFGVPVLSKLPLVGNRVFSNTAIGRETAYLWIPRSRAKVVQHTPAQQAQIVKPLSDDSPPMGHKCQATCVVDRLLSESSGDIAETTVDKLTLVTNVAVAKTTATPFVGDLPLIGRAFRKTTFQSAQHKTEVSRASILYLTVAPSAGEAATAEEAANRD